MIDGITRDILEQRDNIENQRNREFNSNREALIKKQEKEIERLNNIINSIKEEIESYIDITIDHFETCNEEINFELRNKCRAMREIKEDILKILENELKGDNKYENRL